MASVTWSALRMSEAWRAADFMLIEFPQTVFEKINMINFKNNNCKFE